jgi:hypothetical protein
LTSIPFHGVEETSPCEGISRSIEKAARSPCIFEAVAIIVLEELRLHCSDVGVTGHCLHQGTKPLGGNLDIVIEQEDIVPCGVGDRCVVAMTEEPVVRVANNFYGGVLLGNPGR